MSKRLKLYWCRGEGRGDTSKQNFGDYLSPLLTEMIGGRKVVYSPIHNADLMAIGSIIGREKKVKRFGIKRPLHIWGSGSGNDEESYSGRHYYHAVRGELTRGMIKGLKQESVLGDPGLLAPMLLTERELSVKKQYDVAVIAHYADKNSASLRVFTEHFPRIKVIDVFSPVKEVIKEISKSSMVFSSSLHGLIVADSLGVPNQWLKLSPGVISEYKFADYYSAFGLKGIDAIEVEDVLGGAFDMDKAIGQYRREGLSDIQTNLERSFPKGI